VRTRLAAAALLLLGARPAHAHRLDEYLQATTFMVGKDRVRAQIRLAPGVAVLPEVLARIDANADGVLSPDEQRAYAERVLGDLSLAVDGAAVRPRLVSVSVAELALFRDGMGDVVIDFEADVPPGGASRRLTFENRHLPRISVYLVNALVPRDPDVDIVAQRRNYEQSTYRLDYVQAGVPSGVPTWLGAAVLLTLTSLGGAVLLRQRRAPRARAVC
jgi:hypothetical protein